MKNNFLRLNLLLLLLVFPVFSYSQTLKPGDDPGNTVSTINSGSLEQQLSEIDAYAAQVMKDWNQPGMAIAIVKDGKTVFAKGYGVKRIESSPVATYIRLFKAVKAKNTEAIKREMSEETHSFTQMVAKQQDKQIEDVYANGFTATTLFSTDLPKMRDEIIKDGWAYLEVFNETDKNWENLPFVFENGDWKLAIGEIIAGTFQNPGKTTSDLEAEKKIIGNQTIYIPNSSSSEQQQTTESNLVDENTVFAIASNSKAFTTAALAILIDEGKISGWDDKVSKYLPEFQMYSPYVTEDITIRDLVSHRVGLDTFSGDLLWYETTYTDDEILKRLEQLKPTRGFRSGFGYQNLMFIAAGKIIEKVSGKPWGAFVTEKILKPLKMNRTTTSIKDIKDNAAFPHNESMGTGLRVLHRGNVDGAAAAAGLNSSVTDVAKWLRLQLNQGEFEGKRIYSEKTAWEMWQPAVVLPLSKGATEYLPTRHFNTYGLGWNIFDYHGKKIVNHGGGLDGMLSKTVLIPEEKAAFVVLTNGETPVYNIMQSKILDVLVNAPKRDWNAETLKRAEAGKKAEAEARQKLEASRILNTKTSLELKNYAGIYSGTLYGDAEITEENGKLVLRLKPAPNFVADLEHWHYDTFRIKWRPSVAYNFPAGFVSFTIDKNAKPDELKIDQPNNDFWFYELEFKKKK